MTSRFSVFKSLLSHFFSIAVITVALASSAKAAETPTLHIVTDSFAPLQYLENGKPAGYVIEYVNATISKIRSKHALQVDPVEFLPWKRALLVAKDTPNTLFFSVLRTEEREQSYQWIETVSPYQRFFFNLKGKASIHPQNLSELRDSSLIVGVQRGSADEALLEQNGFKADYDYTTFTHFDQGIKMLYHDRIDILPLTSFLARTTACKAGFDGDQLEMLFEIENFTDVLWATMSHDSDPVLVSELHQAMVELKQDGYYDTILAQHLNAWENRPCVAE